MALFAEDLGCDVVGSSTKSSFSLTVKINFSGQAEISQLDLKLQQEQNELFFCVAQFWDMTSFLFYVVPPNIV